jgi:hypothetical protein
MNTPACACEAGMNGSSNASNNQRVERNIRIEILQILDPTCKFDPQARSSGSKERTVIYLRAPLANSIALPAWHAFATILAERMPALQSSA